MRKDLKKDKYTYISEKCYQKIKKQLHKKSNYVTRAELNQIKKLCRKWV